MEVNTDFEYLKEVLLEIGQAVMTYKSSFLIADNKIASGKLVDYDDPNKVEMDNNSVYIKEPAYAANVEFGRRGNNKFPPVKKIEKWIKDKHIGIPKGLKSKSFAFIIARSIAKKGIPAGLQLEKALDIVFEQYDEVINMAISKDADRMIKEILVDLDQFSDAKNKI